MFIVFKIINKKLWPALYQLVGSFLIAFSWNWYHLRHVPYWRFALFIGVEWLLVLICYLSLKCFYLYLVKRFQRHIFWQTKFYNRLDQLFFISALFFIIFFLRQEWLSLIYVSGWLLFFNYFLSCCFCLHPNAVGWLKVKKTIFILTYFLFSIFQYIAFKFYILDANIKYHNIVLFRSLAMTTFWLLLFAIFNLLFWFFKNYRWRYVFIIFWSVLLLAAIFIWLVNVAIVYFSGLYFSPIALLHSSGSAGVIFNWLTILLLISGLMIVAFFIFILILVIKNLRSDYLCQWFFGNLAIVCLAVPLLITVASFRNTPEFVIVKSFYDYWSGNYQKVELSSTVKTKLERFGLDYDLNSFYVSYKDKIFTGQQKLLPAKFDNQKPNIIIIFLESFSSQLIGVYNNQFKDLTPGLNKMAANKNTTIFKNYFNASTPTVTGLLAQLCSFLPPTGHNEIDQEKRLQKVHLSCLPEILKEQGGYKYTNYVTAVSKNFANKGSIFSSIGTYEVYGTEELSKLISEKPLSWGYSDHQLFPIFRQIIERKAQEPFLAMLSTVDTHPPFNLAKDAIKYQDGKQEVLNAIHTTDDAFSKFWDEFKNSRYYQNTILIAVADHAIFPAQAVKEVLGEKYNTYYAENVFMVYAPDNILSKEINIYSSSVDFTPTILQLLNINLPNVFDGRSIFEDRKKYPNLLGMHELGLYINQLDDKGKRKVDYQIPSEIKCTDKDYSVGTSTPLTLCEYLEFYKWKRRMFEEGRLWMKL